MTKNLKSFLYSLIFIYIIYLCIKGLVKLFLRPKNQVDLSSKTKFVFILFSLLSLIFIFLVYYMFDFEQVNVIYKNYLYVIFTLFIIGILNNEIFNFGYNGSKNQEKTDINELFNYFKKNNQN